MDKKSLVDLITASFKDRFRVIDNTGDDKKVVEGQFPDVILMRPEPPPNNDIIFVMKFEDGGDLLASVPVWKALGSTPSVFYIVVPEDKLDEAKRLASATGVRARFAAYKVENNRVNAIRYE